MCPARFEIGLSGALIAMFGSMDTLPLGRGCKSRIDHYLVDRVPRLGDDKLQVQVGQARDHNGLRSGAGRCPELR